MIKTYCDGLVDVTQDGSSWLVYVYVFNGFNTGLDLLEGVVVVVVHWSCVNSNVASHSGVVSGGCF